MLFARDLVPAEAMGQTSLWDKSADDQKKRKSSYLDDDSVRLFRTLPLFCSLAICSFVSDIVD